MELSVNDACVRAAAGSGASEEGNEKGWGNRPFLDLLDVDTKQKRRLWQSSPPFFESSGTLLVDVQESIRYPPACGPAAAALTCTWMCNVYSPHRPVTPLHAVAKAYIDKCGKVTHERREGGSRLC